jgi:WhiB family redox-sensing transcriptional regulator
MTILFDQTIGRSPAAPSAPSVPDDERGFVELGLCRGRTRLFFPGHNERPSARARREQRAKALCADCPVEQSCRDYGRRHAEYGIWGGETEEERVLAGVVLVYPYSPRSVQRLLDERKVTLRTVTEPLQELGSRQAGMTL